MGCFYLGFVLIVESCELQQGHYIELNVSLIFSYNDPYFIELV
jgi:hypothetical protein